VINRKPPKTDLMTCLFSPSDLLFWPVIMVSLLREKIRVSCKNVVLEIRPTITLHPDGLDAPTLPPTLPSWFFTVLQSGSRLFSG